MAGGEGSEHFNFPTVWIKEGEIKVLVPKLEAFVEKPGDYAPSKAPVFYNPVMEMNRDFAVVTLQIFQRSIGRSLVVCEPLAGCGVRGIRFAVEVENVERVVLNDINPEAFKLMTFNVKENNLAGKIEVQSTDANLLLSLHAAPKKRFDYIDIDPFGSPVPYLDSSIRALKAGGLLALTSTDLAPLCGVHPQACIRKYGAKPLRTEYCHELALRILLGCLAREAAKYEIGIKPIFGYYADHYIRAYTRMLHGARKSDQALKKLGYIYHCHNCLHREVVSGLFSLKEKKCPICGRKMAAAGPLWTGELADENYCNELMDEVKKRKFKNKRRMLKILDLIIGEVNAPPTYFDVGEISDKFGFLTPSPRKVVEKLREEGFFAVLTHFRSTAFKTNAPSEHVIKIVKELAKA
ncbi:MAG TPA: tRNA (guanine(10)-N(2))-dimethyltransferase [Candidatus Bathyarchaeota archaeon]|nr:tRNA (guanine(10)-N(2))-dimethyltransferase [Candidatus Bathyarchaeota archaeon]